MSQALALSYVVTLLGLLLGAPYLMFAFARRIRGSALPIVHGAMLGIVVETVIVLIVSAAAHGFGMAALRPPLAAGLLGAALAFGIEVFRALSLGRLATGVRSTRAAAHFGFGWGCGVAAYKGVLLLVALWVLLYGDFQEMLASFPEADRQPFAIWLASHRKHLVETSPLRPPLEHVAGYGLEAFFSLVFTLIVVRAWTRGESAAWLRAGALHALLSGVTGSLLATRPGWGGLVAALLLQGSAAVPAARWAARQIVRAPPAPPGG
jgi:hypothetical protein